MEEGPASSGCTGVLASHEEGDHDVGNLLVREGLARLVLLVLKRGEHVKIRLGQGKYQRSRSTRHDHSTHCLGGFTASLEDGEVELGHLDLSSITAPV